MNMLVVKQSHLREIKVEIRNSVLYHKDGTKCAIARLALKLIQVAIT